MHASEQRIEKSIYLCSVLREQHKYYRFKKQRKWKKLVFLFVAFAAVSFASCGNKAQSTEETTDSVAVETVEEAAPVVDSAAVATDSVASDSVVAE